jgi:hypothetical protein
MAATIPVYRDGKTAGVKELLLRIPDYPRVKAKAWYVPVLPAGPCLVFTQYGIALRSGLHLPPPRFTLLVPLSFLGFFSVAYRGKSCCAPRPHPSCPAAGG